MEKFKVCLFIVVTILNCAGCSKEDDQVCGSPEEVLPGFWKIESVRLTDYGMDVTYQGSTFFNDTVLFDVGSIQIDPFSLDSLEAKDLEKHKVECRLQISDGQMEVSMNSLFMGGGEMFAAIRYNGPSGPQLLDTQIEEFYYSSHIFNNLYTLEITDADNVKLPTSNDKENHIITLIRA